VSGSPTMAPPIRLGLRENVWQFSLLVVVNAFVGAMVGLERSILPAIAEQEFHLAARSAILSFIVVFGVAKALTNYGAGRWADRAGRKAILVAGWLVAVPVPFLLMWAPSWNWVLVANLFLGVSQGLTWSTTVIMKIDLVGPRQRGLDRDVVWTAAAALLPRRRLRRGRPHDVGPTRARHERPCHTGNRGPAYGRAGGTSLAR
jgi:MFS family permease